MSSSCCIPCDDGEEEEDEDDDDEEEDEALVLAISASAWACFSSEAFCNEVKDQSEKREIEKREEERVPIFSDALSCRRRERDLKTLKDDVDHLLDGGLGGGLTDRILAGKTDVVAGANGRHQGVFMDLTALRGDGSEKSLDDLKLDVVIRGMLRLLSVETARDDEDDLLEQVSRRIFGVFDDASKVSIRHQFLHGQALMISKSVTTTTSTSTRREKGERRRDQDLENVEGCFDDLWDLGITCELEGGEEFRDESPDEFPFFFFLLDQPSARRHRCHRCGGEKGRWRV